MSELLPCPFCGGKAEFHNDKEICPDGCHHVHCKGCGAMVDYSEVADPTNSCETLKELQAYITPIWNTRAAIKEGN
jgi:hypothetical protein